MSNQEDEFDLMSLKAAIFLSACGVVIHAMLIVGAFVGGMIIGAQVYNVIV